MNVRLGTSRTILVGPVLDSDGVAKTDLAVAAILASKNGGNPAALDGSATLTHKQTGHYLLLLTANDISALGCLELSINSTTDAMPIKSLNVLTAAAWDALHAASGGYVPADMTHIHGTALTETATQLAGAFTKFFDVAAPTATCLSLPDAVPGEAGGGFIAGQNAATGITTALTANITGDLSGSVGSVTTKTGYALTGDYDAAKTAAQAGNAMALTSGERTTLAAVIEGAILAEGDGNAVIAAIVAAIDAADIDVITASVIAAEVKSQMQAAGTHLTLIKAVTDALPDAGALTTIAADAARLTAERAAVLTDWINAGRLDAILDIIAADTTTDIPALIATAQSDLDTLTGTDGATLATTQGNYAPAVAGDKMDLLDSIMEDVV